MFFRSLATGLAAVALISTAPAQVPEQPQLRIDMQVEREITVVPPSGQVEIRREPVQEATVGDVLVYTLEILNLGPGSAHNARVVDPVPEGTVLVPESMGGQDAEASVSNDGGVSYAAYPITRSILRDDGTSEELPIPLEEYTHVRWVLTEPLDPGEKRIAYFKVRVQ